MADGITALSEAVQTENERLQGEVRKKGIGVVVLVLFVIAYMFFIDFHVSKLVRPASVADRIINYVKDHDAEVRSKILLASEDAIPGLLNSGVGEVYAMLPKVRASLSREVQKKALEIPPQFKQAVAAMLNNSLRPQKEALVNAFLHNAGSAERLARRREFIRRFKTRLSALLQNQSSYNTAGIRRKLDHLINTPAAKLSADELLVKKIIINFLYMRDYNAKRPTM
ncbi:MAG: hypothetical protein GXP59_02395 [Deltaproteobacteria bacterium]|nr:hypothetical protein [Deltaproteobacteria bacterium]